MNSAGMDLHALAKFGVCARFVLVPAVSEPSLDLPHLPVQLLGQAVQMAGVRILHARKGETVQPAGDSERSKRQKGNRTFVMDVNTFSRTVLG